MKLIVLAGLLALAGCAVRMPAAPEPGAGLDEVAQHETKIEIFDITDTGSPRLIWTGGNVIGQCGVRSLMASMFGFTTMGTAEGAADTLGQRCAGTSTSGHTRKPCTFGLGSSIFVGRGSASSCTAPATPWKCCTGAGAGCTPDKVDVVTFAEGQPNQTLVGVETNYRELRTTGNVYGLAPDDGYPQLFWNGSSKQGLVWQATANAGAATFPWCELAVRSATVSANSGCGPVDGGNTPFVNYPGWQLNHAAISPCTPSKGTTDVWRVVVTILFD